jgi:hypothetical protein
VQFNKGRGVWIAGEPERDGTVSFHTHQKTAPHHGNYCRLPFAIPAECQSGAVLGKKSLKYLSYDSVAIFFRHVNISEKDELLQ